MLSNGLFDCLHSGLVGELMCFIYVESVNKYFVFKGRNSCNVDVE